MIIFEETSCRFCIVYKVLSVCVYILISSFFFSAQEIKQLKKDIQIITEQNLLYEKLLEQSNVNLVTLPKKSFKYTNKFERTNGVLTVKNADSKANVSKDIGVQVGNSVNNLISGNLSCAVTKDKSKVSNSGIRKYPKTSTKNTSSSSKPVKIASAVTVSFTTHSNGNQSDSIVSATLVTQASYQANNISQDNVIPVISWNDPARNSATAHAGGVTTVLSQFPVMSTTLGSSFSNVYNKNVPTLIIPTGSNIIQSFPTEKSSNTISFLCPSTLPILVPQQVLNVPSISRNVGLPPSIICPAPVNSSSSQIEKSNMGSALLTMNPNPIVPISSSLSNTQIILPSQAALLGNTCGNVNLSHNIISPVLTAVSQSEDLIVPLVPKLPASSSSSKSVQDSNIASDNSCGCDSKTESNEAVAFGNSFELNKNLANVHSLNLSECTEPKDSQKYEINKKKPNYHRRSLCLNVPPSLQVLSANKIISLANQSQNLRKMTLNKEIKGKTHSENSDVTESTSKVYTTTVCAQIKDASPEKRMQHAKKSELENSKKNTTGESNLASTQTASDISSVKSGFSLTVLMGDTLTDKTSPENRENSVNDKFPHIQNNVSVSDTNCSSSKNIAYINSSAESVSFSNIPDSEVAFNVTKGSVLMSSVQLSSDTCTSQTNLGAGKVRTPNSVNSKTLISNNQSLSSTETLNNSIASVNIPTESHLNNSTESNSVISTASCNANTEILSKQISDTDNFPSKKIVNIIHNDHNKCTMCSDVDNSVNNVPLSVNESSVNPSMLPSLFPNNQIMSINSPVLVCHAGHENSSSLFLSQSLQVSSESTNQNLNNCLLHYTHGDFQTFSVVSNPVTTISSINNHNKKSPDADLNFPENSSISNNQTECVSHKVEATNENSCEKEFAPSKRRNKSTCKESKLNDKDVSSLETFSAIPNNSVNNKIHTGDTINSFSKSNSPGCSGQEPSFNYASDILARATETIFCNDILENTQGPKRSEGCFSDDVPSLNVIVTTTEKDVDNYKVHYNQVRENHNIPANGVEKNRKNISGSSLTQSEVTNSTHLRNIQEINLKQTKFCKLRKSKSSADSEPPCKKLKETTQESEKSHTYSLSQHSDKVIEKSILTAQPNLTFLDKQVSSPVQTSADDQNGSFNNQIHLSDGNCKTLSSVDTMFSLTPMLGDILKDVSHNVALDSRNTTFGTGNENQSLFSSEKNFISFSYPNTSNEDFLNLPRMPFPIIPENSSTPVNVTTVSFAHSVSLCSTQSDSPKVIETVASTDSQNKPISKKKDVLPLFHNNHNILNLDLASTNNMDKQSECVMKSNNSEPHFNVTLTKATNTSAHYENLQTGAHIHIGSSVHSTNLAASPSSSQYNSRDNFIAPSSHSISFYPTISSSSTVQNFPCTNATQPHVSFSNNVSNMEASSVTFSTSGNSSNTFNSQPALSKPDNLSHSLCSLLKESSNIVEDRGGTNEALSQTAPSSSSNIAQSKYSALSLISDQTSYSDSVPNSSCHSHFVQNSSVHTTSGSDSQFMSAVSSCSRNPKISLSYSAESLLQTHCANSDKNKNKNNRFQPRTPEKKADRNNMSNMHAISDTNIFMPLTSCDINIQNAPLVPLPPVTSFHNFSSAYSVCDTAPSTTLFNAVSRTQDIPLSLSNDNFLNHMNLNVDSQMLSSRHEVSSAVPKPHSSITLQFENPNSLYNNCNFLTHVKPGLESSRSSEASACFQPSSYSNSYSQQSQKPNCCQFTHRAGVPNSDVSSDINLSVSGTVPTFHNEKNHFQPNRPGLQTSFSQSNSNFMGNFFYNTSANCHDGNERNDLNIKPSSNRTSQEVFVPEGVRQNIHDQNTNAIFNSRKTTTSNRAKSKKPKNITPNENISGIPACISNYNSQDNSCNKVNISYISNGYFKSGAHPVLAPPSQIQCSQNKMSDNVPSSVIPANPSFSPVLHQQSDNFLNLNFQHPNFTVSPLPRPPTQPLSCSCLTTPIISHTFSSTTAHPVPNFNLSNILPDMGCSASQVSFSPTKFPMNHALSSSSTQCQTNSTITNSAHIVSHQSCAPSLYPPHPPMVRGTLNPILGHNSQTLIDSQVSLVATAGSVMSQNTTFTATQNPTFRNVIHPITFPRNVR